MDKDEREWNQISRILKNIPTPKLPDGARERLVLKVGQALSEKKRNPHILSQPKTWLGPAVAVGCMMLSFFTFTLIDKPDNRGIPSIFDLSKSNTFSPEPRQNNFRVQSVKNPAKLEELPHIKLYTGLNLSSLRFTRIDFYKEELYRVDNSRRVLVEPIDNKEKRLSSLRSIIHDYANWLQSVDSISASHIKQEIYRIADSIRIKPINQKETYSK